MENPLDRLEDFKIGGVSSDEIFWATTVLISSLLFVYVLKRIVMRRLKKWCKESGSEDATRAADVVDNVLSWQVIFIAALFIATSALDLPEFTNMAVKWLFLTLIAWYVAKLLFVLLDIGIAYGEREKAHAAHIVSFFRTTVRIVVLVVVGLWYMSSIGIDVTAFIAGFGILGLAIAFALQNIIADLFASLILYIDGPFDVGDSIKVGGDGGTVEKIGIRSTHIRTYAGHLLVIPNRELSTCRINNFKEMERRRVRIRIGVDYATPVEKLRAIPDMMKGIVEALEHTDFSRAHLTTMGDFSLGFELVFYITSSDYTIYLNTLQAANLAILEGFEERGIQIPFPTNTVVLQK